MDLSLCSRRSDDANREVMQAAVDMDDVGSITHCCCSTKTRVDFTIPANISGSAARISQARSGICSIGQKNKNKKKRLMRDMVEHR